MTDVTKTCFKCQAANKSEQAFCGVCGSRLDLDLYISERLKVELAASFRERALLETESAIRVFEKAFGWFEKMFKYSLAALALILATLAWQYKDWHEALLAAKQAFVADVNSTTAGIHADESTTIAGIRKEESAFHSDLDRSRSSLEGAAKLKPQMTAMQAQLHSATQDIEAQKKVLASSETLAKEIFSSHVNKSFAKGIVSTQKYAVVKKDGGTSSTIYLLLDSAPIPQTLQVYWGALAQPSFPIRVQHNLLILDWSPEISELPEDTLSFLYFPDPSDKTVYKSLSVANGKIYVDGVQRNSSRQ